MEYASHDFVMRRLLAAGHSPREADEITREILTHVYRDPHRRPKKTAWDDLLHDLQEHLKALQRAKYRWEKCPHRAPVFNAYLTLLYKVRHFILRSD